MSFFHILAVVNNAAMNIGVLISVCVSAVNSFGYIPQNGIAGSYGSSILKFLQNCHTVFHCAYTILHSTVHKGSISPHPCQHLLFSSSSSFFFFASNHPNGCEVAFLTHFLILVLGPLVKEFRVPASVSLAGRERPMDEPPGRKPAETGGSAQYTWPDPSTHLGLW